MAALRYKSFMITPDTAVRDAYLFSLMQAILLNDPACDRIALGELVTSYAEGSMTFDEVEEELESWTKETAQALDSKAA